MTYDLRILNSSGPDCDNASEEMGLGTLQLSKSLQKAMLQMRGEFMGGDGRSVDYGRLATSTLFKHYAALAGRLRTCTVATLSEPQRMAFFINVYNALTIHGLVSLSCLPGSVLEVQYFWKTTCYDISGLVFSLDDIEHGILRGNKPHPSSTQPLLGDADPRRQLSLKSCDPRVHFALVCGAKSCPAIQVYSEDNLEQALTMAAQSFCGQEVHTSPSDMKVSVNKILQWYASDFGSSVDQILRYLSLYLPEVTRVTLLAMMDRGPVTIESREYNWTLNKL